MLSLYPIRPRVIRGCKFHLDADQVTELFDDVAGKAFVVVATDNFWNTIPLLSDPVLVLLPSMMSASYMVSMYKFPLLVSGNGPTWSI